MTWLRIALAGILLSSYSCSHGQDTVTQQIVAHIKCPVAFQTVVLSDREARSLSGIVIAAGAPAENFTVFAKNLSTSTILRQTTDAKGVFDFGLYNGIYEVTLCKEGFDSAEAKVLVQKSAKRGFLVFEIGASESWPPTKFH